MQNVINQTFVWQVSGEHISVLPQETGQSSFLSFCLLVFIISQEASCVGKDSNGDQNVASRHNFHSMFAIKNGLYNICSSEKFTGIILPLDRTLEWPIDNRM